MPRDVLVVGSGAREHAILWGISQSHPSVKCYVAPGNAGMEALAERVLLSHVSDIAQWAKGRELLVVIGPEAPLAEGLADLLRVDGHWVVGPNQQAAQLESDKNHAKEIMKDFNIPTAEASTWYSASALRECIERETKWPHVMKQTGLAGGKGVVIVSSAADALILLEEWDKVPGLVEQGILWEEYLEGQEVSIHILTNGKEFQWLPLTQDHKRLTAETNSPNTGGMGAYGPVTWIDAKMRKHIDHAIIQPMMRYLQEKQLLYRGILYIGIMMTEKGPYVLEFNVRLGDPEAEVIIPLIASDWYQIWAQLSQGIVLPLPIPQGHRVAVVLASEGYPANPLRGQPIMISPVADAIVFHGATQWGDQTLLANGGRVLTVVGKGHTLAHARNHAYAQVGAIDFPQSQYRTDIASNSLT